MFWPAWSASISTFPAISLLRNFLRSSVCQGINLGALLAARVAMARYLGPADYGGFGVGLNCATVFYKVGALGIVPAVQYHGSKSLAERPGFFPTALLMSLAVSAVLAALALVGGETLFGSYWVDQPIGYGTFVIFAAFLPAVMLGDVLSILLIPREKMLRFNITQLMTGCLFLMLFFAGLPWLEPLHAAVSAQVLTWVAVLLFGVVNFRREIRAGGFEIGLVPALLSYGLRTWPYVLLAVGTARFAVVYGASLVSESDAGQYIVAMNVVDGLFGFHGALGQLLLSKVSREESAARAAVQATLRISAAGLLTLAAVYLIGGRPIFDAVFGVRYADAFALSLVLLIMRSAHAQQTVFASYLAGNGMPGRNTVTLSVEMLALLVSVPVLTGGFGVEGLAWAAALSALVGLAVSSWQGARVLNSTLADLYLVRPGDVALLIRQVRALRPGARQETEIL